MCLRFLHKIYVKSLIILSMVFLICSILILELSNETFEPLRTTIYVISSCIFMIIACCIARCYTPSNNSLEEQLENLVEADVDLDDKTEIIYEIVKL